jgi:hypothetical protein
MTKSAGEQRSPGSGANSEALATEVAWFVLVLLLVLDGSVTDMRGEPARVQTV